MNCQNVRNRILSLPDPRPVPDALRAHLDGCPECVQWWRHAARLERLLAELPAPPAPAGKKEALIDELAAAGPVIKAVPATAAAPSPGLVALRRNWKPVAGLAAAVLVAVGGWQVWPRPAANNHSGPVALSHQFLSNQVRRQTELAQARDAEQKLRILGEQADDLTNEARTLARVSVNGETDSLARWFEQTVDGGLRKAKELGGRTLTPAEQAARRHLLDGLAAKLAATERDIGGLVPESPAKARPALQKMVDKAGSGQTELRKLAGEM